MQIQCPKCQGWSESEGDICPLCGASLTAHSHDVCEKTKKPTKKFYQYKRFWFFTVIGLSLVVCWGFFHSVEKDPKKVYIKKQNEIIYNLSDFEWRGGRYDTFFQAVDPECLWYFENIPRRVHNHSGDDNLSEAVIHKHQNDKCTRGMNDNVLSSWHWGENENHEQICYTYSLHPPKDTAEYEPGLFRLSVVNNSCDLRIESMSSFTPGLPPVEGKKLFTYSIAYDKDPEVNSNVVDNFYKKDFEFYSFDLKKGKYLHAMIPVWRSDYSVDENMFFYAYRVFPLEGIQICGQLCNTH